MARWLRTGLSLLIVLACAAPAVTGATEYNFTKIVETPNTKLDWLSPYPSINNSGVVAYLGGMGSEFYGVYTHDGNSTKTIAESGSQIVQLLFPPSINDSGTVAFQALASSGYLFIYTSSGNGFSTVISNEVGNFVAFGAPKINNTGDVAFSAALVDHDGIYRAKNGAVTTIADTTGEFTTVLPEVSLNDNGVVVFQAMKNILGGVYTGSGGSLTTIAGAGTTYSGFLPGVDINQNGLIGYGALRTRSLKIDLLLGDGTTSSTFVTGGADSPFTLFGRGPVVTNGGQVVYQGTLDTQQMGIFTGPNPDTDAVIKTGDILGGLTVFEVSVSNECVNEKGQIVFYVNFDESGEALYRADPVTGNSGTFSDVPPSHWAYDYVEALAAAGITQGCGNGLYCPDDPVTRAQMAVFIERGMHTEGYTPPSATGVFSDVPTDYWAAAWIEQFYSDGITSGCKAQPLEYCPDDLVTRAEMAIFLLRAKYSSSYRPSLADGTVFADVPSDYWACAWIEDLYDEEITSGCQSSPLLYCPNDSVTRAQMAAFLTRTFGLE